MDRSLSLLRLFTELSVLPTCLSVRYHFIAQPKTLDEAQMTCTKNHTVMATAEEMTDIDMFNTVTANGNTFEQEKSTWRWSLDGTELNVTFWDENIPKQPDNKLQDELCVFTQNMSWHDNTCDRTHSFVCYDEKNLTNKYIHIVNSEMKWPDSQRYCRHNYTDLASVRNTTERDGLQRILATGNAVWIGLHKVPCVWGWCNSLQSSLDKRPFICYDDELVLVQQNKTWSEALWYCRNQGWELVSVLNQNIQNWVQKKADNASSLYVWLGLRYSCALDFWFWVSGNVSCYQNWVEVKSSHEQCGTTGAVRSGMDQRDENKNKERNERDEEPIVKGKWNKLPEAEMHNFICSKSHDY